MDLKRQDTNKYLQLFNIILTKGTRCDNGFELDGINAYHDFDGYTCWLSYQDLIITLFFHGKYKAEYQHLDTKKRFTEKMMSLINQFSE